MVVGSQLSRRMAVAESPLLTESPLETAEVAVSWEAAIATLGPALGQLRQRQGHSLDWLHFRTQVPRYHLQALEQGLVERLPEEIFVRGFVRRIIAALGEEAALLGAELPSYARSSETLLAAWQQPPSRNILELRSAHLYLAYGLLVAGSAGGVILSSQESGPLSERQPQPGLQGLRSPGQGEASSVLPPGQMANQQATRMMLAVGPERLGPELSSGGSQVD